MCSNYESESEKGGHWSFSPGAVDLVKGKYKKKIGENNCGAIVKVKVKKRGQWSFSLGAVDLVTTEAKHANGKLAKMIV